MFTHKKRTIPQLNTTSTADISFMLLIFFLVTTSTDTDMGISRQLPPYDASQQQSTSIAASESRVMHINITAADSIIVDGQNVDAEQLASRIVAFASRIGKDHSIVLNTDRSASYDTYFQVQNAVSKAYDNLRNREAQRRYGKLFALLGQEEQAEIRASVPEHLAEVYTMSKGGAQ